MAVGRKPTLTPAILSEIEKLNRTLDTSPDVHRARKRALLKWTALQCFVPGSLAAFAATGGSGSVRVVSILFLGLIVIPAIRTFMHYQAHWGMGDGALANWILDRIVSLQFSVQQTGFRLAHQAHHLHGNDFDPRGLPRNLMSTYLFSRNGQPASLPLWCGFHVLVFQSAIHLLHVLNSRARADLASYALDSGMIIGVHGALAAFDRDFYLGVYLPSLALGWLVSALGVYAIHLGEASDPAAQTSLHAGSNRWLENEGYQHEHHLFPGLHPVFLPRAHSLIRPSKEKVIRVLFQVAAVQHWLRLESPREGLSRRSS